MEALQPCQLTILGRNAGLPAGAHWLPVEPLLTYCSKLRCHLSQRTGVLGAILTRSTTLCCVQDWIKEELMPAKATVVVHWSANTMASGLLKEPPAGELGALLPGSMECTPKCAT
ncbi:uncharacterized protein LOC144655481 [Oculina patagonica]